MTAPNPTASEPGAWLTASELAREAGTSLEYVRRLESSGAIHPNKDGLHPAAHIVGVRVAWALAKGGVDVDGLLWAMKEGILLLDRLAGMWRIPPFSGQTFAEYSASLGERARHLPAIYAAFGLAPPLPETEMRQDEQAVVTDFIEAWGLVDDRREVYLRAARIAGEGIRRTDLATLDLFDEIGGSPPQRSRAGYSDDDAVLPSNLLGALIPRLYDWLHTRHLEHEVFERIVNHVEGALASTTTVEQSPREPPAIAFIDLAGYTALTQTVGDEQAARSLLSLQELAEAAAHSHGGRIVKLLGDGVMLRYGSARDAVASMLELMASITAAGLPPAHAGIADGPVVSRDGDVFGHTVNLAARIGAHASAGQLLVTRSMVKRLDPAIRWDEAGVVQFKGIEDGVPLARIARSRDDRSHTAD